MPHSVVPAAVSYRWMKDVDVKKVVLQFLMEAHSKAMERHLPYGIIQCYLQATQANAPRLNQSQIGRYSMLCDAYLCCSCCRRQ